MSFENSKVRKFVEQHIEPDDKVLNACAGESKLASGDVTRNDLREDVDATYHVDVTALSQKIDETFDVIVYDPPFSPEQTQTYGLERSHWPGYGEDVKEEFRQLLEPGGKLIQLGFHAVLNSAGAQEYRTEAIGVFNQLGRNDDWTIAVGEYTSPDNDHGEAGPLLSAQERTAPNDPRRSNDSSFDLSYRQYKGEVADEIVATRLLREISGKTLALHWGDPPQQFQNELDNRPSQVEEVVPYHGPADRIVTHSLGAGESKSGITLQPEKIADAIPDIAFDTVVLWPHHHATNWTVSYRGEECGYVRACKRELDSILPGTATVIIIGSSATGMRSDWNYSHDGVEVLDGADELRCIYLSRFSKAQQALGERKTTNAPVDIRYRETNAEGNWIVIHSRDTLHNHPALYVDCPECGAQPNNLCVGSSTDQIHEERVKFLNSQIRNGESIRVFQHRRHKKVDLTPEEPVDSCATPSQKTNTGKDSDQESFSNSIQTELPSVG